MRRKGFSIWSVLLVLVVSTAVLVPGCGGTTDTVTTGCTVDVEATLDGTRWTGGVQYTLAGPAGASITGTSVDTSHSVNCGGWTCAYVSGGPAGASFVSITPLATQTVSAVGTITFTLNFVTSAATTLDHFTCYWTGEDMEVGQDVHLEDQFGTWEVVVGESWYLCNPAEKSHDGVLTPISDLDHHLMIYGITPQPDYWYVQVSNQFGTYQLTLQGPMALAVPTQKLSPGNHGLPVGLDHFLLYEVVPPGPTVNQIVDLNDEFADGPDLLLTDVVFFANPVKKILMEGGQPTGDVYSIQHPDDHLLFCAIEDDIHSYEYVNIDNQFGDYTFPQVEGPWLLAVPSDKISFESAQSVELDHFLCYGGELNPLYHWGYMNFQDQFGTVDAYLSVVGMFAAPVEKERDGVVTPISNPDHHLMFYNLYYEEEPQNWLVEVDNQFGTQQLTVYGPLMVAVPTQKLEPGDHGPPVGLDHFLLYQVVEGPDLNVIVDLKDQFGSQSGVEVGPAVWFANPVKKTDENGIVTDIQNPDAHLVFYDIYSTDRVSYHIQAVNQIGEHTFDVQWRDLLAVPSEKTDFEPVEPAPAVLDHFMCYWVGEDMALPEWPGVVYLEDQLCAVTAEVGTPWGFWNPAEKWHDGVTTPISNPDHHLLAYDIYCEEEPQWWQVEVSNQFGIQTLVVYGPVALALPTQKIEPMYHEPPVGLDHFMLYEVIEGPPVNVAVSLNDQFGDQPQVEVGYPDYFFIPVQKTDASGMVTPIENPLGHLVSYEIYGQVLYRQVQAVNQFGEHIFPDLEGPYCLTVPSEKMTWQQLPPQQ